MNEALRMHACKADYVRITRLGLTTGLEQVEGQWEYYGGLKNMKWHGKGKLWWSAGGANRKTLLWYFSNAALWHSLEI